MTLFICPAELSAKLFVQIDSSFIILLLLIGSYVAGQYLRVRQLSSLEEKLTKHYRVRKAKEQNLEVGILQKRFEAFQQALTSNLKDLKGQGEDDWQEIVKDVKAAKTTAEKEGKFIKLWESFPYPTQAIYRRLSTQPYHSMKFFQMFDQKELSPGTEGHSFVNFCKTIIYEYSSNQKEELLRQEATVRLWAGLYHIAEIGIPIAVFVGGIFLLFGLGNLLVLIPQHGLSDWVVKYFVVRKAYLFWILIVPIVGGMLRFLKKELDEKNFLRRMRLKEVYMVLDAFYVVFQKHNLKEKFM